MRKWMMNYRPVKSILLASVIFSTAMTSFSYAAEEQTRAQQLMGDIAPKLAQLTDDVLYADVWVRPELSPKERSLVTISALVAMDRPAQLRSHIRMGLKNGLTEVQIMETITHLAFYSGWPSSVTAVSVAREVFDESKDQSSNEPKPNNNNRKR